MKKSVGRLRERKRSLKNLFAWFTPSIVTARNEGGGVFFCKRFRIAF